MPKAAPGIALLALLMGCSTVRPDCSAPGLPGMFRVAGAPGPADKAEAAVAGFRMRALPATADNGNTLALATSFSGGGARAAALA